MKRKHLIFSNLDARLIDGKPDVPLKERMNPDAPIYRLHACNAGVIHRLNHDGDTYPVETTETELSQMAENFYSSANPRPVYIGHPDAKGIDAPSCGWILGAEAIGKDLFLYVEPSEELKGWIEEGSYAFCSIFYTAAGIDRDTGDEWGAELFSLGITNQPAKDGLTRLKESQIYCFSTIEAKYLTASEDVEIKLMTPEQLKEIAVALSAEMRTVKMGELESELAIEVAKLLGLPENASTEDILAAVKSAQDAKAAKETEEAETEHPEEMMAETEEAKKKEEDEEEKKKDDEALSVLRAENEQLRATLRQREIEDVIRSAGISDEEDIADFVKIGLSDMGQMERMLKKQNAKQALSGIDIKPRLQKVSGPIPANDFEAVNFAVLDALKKNR